ncbi:MbtH-like protein [Kordia sp. SMS9]|uniref:MbtH family NRPS accessory protein n=1 Tax=Kordia sp. SMS9 TaxID=2282170 RepID=UPI000E0DF3F7|nr:MbtH family NRPS accessory protein [Kordia sp. SMS9]AXG70228.1 MbtH-like protein [Kordia sp. SMS9]
MEETLYSVVVNSEKQYSIWNTDKSLPIGWEEEGTKGTKEDCLEHIKTIWSDIRPKSLMDYIERQIPKKKVVITQDQKDKHLEAIDTYKKRYSAGLDTWSGMDYLKKGIQIFFNDYTSLPSKDVFEIGIGTGRSSETVLELGHSLTGIDVIENDNWSILKEKYGEKFHAFVGDFTEYTRSKKYDIVLDNGCLHHFEPEYYEITFHQIHHLLKSKGWFYLAVFKEDDTSVEEGRVEYIDGGKRRCKYFTKKEIAALFDHYGFTLKDTQEVSRSYDSLMTMLCIAQKQS